MWFKKVALVGVGLLGGSLGMALKRHPNPPEVVGYVRRRASIKECQLAGAVDKATRSLPDAVSGADLVVLCTPIAQMRTLALEMSPGLAPGCVVTDVGSVKAPVTRELEPLVRKAGSHFIGSHPMAGSERMGVSAALPDLFRGAVCVITPTPNSNQIALRKVKALWQSVGGQILLSTPGQHDAWVSKTSHLPHILAATLANLVLSPSAARQQFRLCANGFRDTTRIASGSPEMWRDIAIANGVNLRQSVKAYITELQKLEKMLSRGDADALTRFFDQAKRRRDIWARKSMA